MPWETVQVLPPTLSIELGVNESSIVAEHALPMWSFARLHTALRRSPPNEVLRRCRAAIGRPKADIELATRMLDRLTTMVRDETIRSVRLALGENTYENELKIDVAAERILDDLAGVPWRC